ncbi:MAG: hypothetical protein ACLSCF_05655 [Alistipes finegoldii]
MVPNLSVIARSCLSDVMQSRVRRLEELDVGQPRRGCGFLSVEPCRDFQFGHTLAQSDILRVGRRKRQQGREE